MEESKEWLEFERLRKKIQKKLNCGYGIVPGDSRPMTALHEAVIFLNMAQFVHVFTHISRPPLGISRHESTGAEAG